MLGMVYNNQADIIRGPVLLTEERFDSFTLSTSFLRTHLVAVHNIGEEPLLNLTWAAITAGVPAWMFFFCALAILGTYVMLHIVTLVITEGCVRENYSQWRNRREDLGNRRAAFSD